MDPFRNWKFPGWMKKYLDYLPSLAIEDDTERIEQFEFYMNMFLDEFEDPKDCVLAELMQKQIGLLEALYDKGFLK